MFSWRLAPVCSLEAHQVYVALGSRFHACRQEFEIHWAGDCEWIIDLL